MIHATVPHIGLGISELIDIIGLIVVTTLHFCGKLGVLQHNLQDECGQQITGYSEGNVQV